MDSTFLRRFHTTNLQCRSELLLFLQITIQTGWRHLTQLQTRFCVSGALLTTQTTLGRLVRDGSVKAKISAPVFDSQQI